MDLPPTDLARSADGGRSWSTPQVTDMPASSHHALALSTGLTAVQMRHVRSSLLEVLHQEYVLTARSKGLREQSEVVDGE